MGTTHKGSMWGRMRPLKEGQLTSLSPHLSLVVKRRNILLPQPTASRSAALRPPPPSNCHSSKLETRRKSSRLKNKLLKFIMGGGSFYESRDYRKQRDRSLCTILAPTSSATTTRRSHL